MNEVEVGTSGSSGDFMFIKNLVPTSWVKLYNDSYLFC